MKTQIAKLINGTKNVVRIESMEKYKDAKPATSHTGYAGSSKEERQELMNQVIKENGDTLHVKFLGNEYYLFARRSQSGNIVRWQCNIPEDVASRFVNTDGTIKNYSLSIYREGQVVIDKFNRKNENCQWRWSIYQYIDEGFIEII